MDFPRISYLGDLTAFPVRELVVSLAAQHETGALMLRRDRVLKRLFFDHGRLTCVQSALARCGALRFLCSGRLVDDQRLSAWREHLGQQETPTPFWEFLSGGDGHSRAALAKAQQAWVEAAVRDALAWTEGSYVFLFDDAPPPSAAPLSEPLEVEPLVVSAIRGGLPSGLLRERFAPHLDDAPQLTVPIEEIAERIGAATTEQAILHSLRHATSVRQLVLASDVPSRDVLGLLAMLETLHLVTFPRKARHGKHGQRSGEIGLEGVALISRLKETGETLLHLPPFELLGIRRVFDEEELRRGYYTLAQNYHPKEMVDLLPPDLRELSYRIFERASDIFEALVVWEKRRFADNFAAFRQLEADLCEPANPADVDAERFFLEGQQRWTAGEANEGRRLLQAAVDTRPIRSEYRAWLAWATWQADGDEAANTKTALTELRRAADDDPANVVLQRHYAQLLEALGKREQAYEVYRTAQAWAPDNLELEAGRLRTYSFLTARDLATLDSDQAQTQEEEKNLRVLLERMEKANFFEVLGLPQSAPMAEVRKRYFELAKQYHPDRYKNSRLLDTSEKIFVLVNEAYDTLSSASWRAAYEENLENQKQHIKREERLAEERLLQKGKAFLQANKWAEAAELFERLLQEKRPLPLAYKPFYAWALFNRDFRAEQMVPPKVEKLLTEAGQEDPGLTEIYVIWGKIYRRLEKLAKAKSYFDKALTMEPNHIDALREVRLINQRLGEEPSASTAPDAGDKDKKGLLGSLFGKKKP
jgi:curved DNA-binding protein CbpA